MGGNGRKYLEGLKRFFKDEVLHRSIFPLLVIAPQTIFSSRIRMELTTSNLGSSCTQKFPNKTTSMTAGYSSDTKATFSMILITRCDSGVHMHVCSLPWARS